MRKSKHERELMKQRQKFCELNNTWYYMKTQKWGECLVELGKLFKNKITKFVNLGCSCCSCSSKLRKRKIEELNFKEQKKDFERN